MPEIQIVNCTSYDAERDICLDAAAPRRLFFMSPRCIKVVPFADPRIPTGCARCTPRPADLRPQQDLRHVVAAMAGLERRGASNSEAWPGTPIPLKPAFKAKPKPSKGQVRRERSVPKKPSTSKT